MSDLIERFGALGRSRAPAVIDPNERVGFDELVRRAEQSARGLSAAGLGGQRIALLIEPSAAFVEALFATLLAGAVAVPLCLQHPPPEHLHVLDSSGAAAIVASPGLLDAAAAIARGRPVHRVADLRATAQAASRADASDADTAVILYTSGTTGRPKGALLTHGNLSALAALLGRAWSIAEGDLLVHALPLHHLHGFGIALMTSLLGGATTQLLPRFEPAAVWEALGQATLFMGVPTMHKRLFDDFDAGDAERRRRRTEQARALRLVTSGSAALPVSIGERWGALTGSYPLERFGMTEIGVGASNPLNGERRPGSVGPPLPGMQLRIVDGAGNDVQGGDSGELWIKGPTLFRGYDGDPGATASAHSPDGWFRSGDTACWLPDGYVKILGRTSVDIIKSGGYKLSALEIEELLREHPSVSEAAVVAVADETWGECAVAVVVARGPVAEDGGAQLRAFAKTRLAPYKVPRHVLFRQELPRNPLGKVIKPELSAWAARALAARGR